MKCLWNSSPYQEQEEVQVGGKTVTQGTSTIVYNKAKVNEVFVVTEIKIYSFILHPSDEESTTVMVTESFKDKVDNIKISLSSRCGLCERNSYKYYK